MIEAVFKRSGGRLFYASVSGHAGFADKGNDIVCAAVSSAVQLTANGITEVLGAPLDILAEENRITMTLPGKSRESAYAFIQALLIHIEGLSQEYGKFIKITVLEV